VQESFKPLSSKTVREILHKYFEALGIDLSVSNPYRQRQSGK
jgi:hypothetical protein